MLSAWQSGFADHYMKYTFILLHSAQWHYLSKFLPSKWYYSHSNCWNLNFVSWWFKHSHNNITNKTIIKQIFYDWKSKLNPVSNRFNWIWPGGKTFLAGACCCCWGIVLRRACWVWKAGCWGWETTRPVGRALAMGSGLRAGCWAWAPASCPAKKPAFWWDWSNGFTKGFNPSHPAHGGTKDPSRTPATLGANLAPFLLWAKLRWVGSWGLIKGLRSSSWARIGWGAGWNLTCWGAGRGLGANCWGCWRIGCCCWRGGRVSSGFSETKAAASCPPDGMCEPSRILNPSFPAEYLTVYVCPSSPMYEYCPILDPSSAVSSRKTISFSVANADPALPSPALKRCSLMILASCSLTSWGRPHAAATTQVKTI